MAIVHVQTKQQSPTAATRASSVSSISETFAATPAVGDLVVVFLGFFSSGAGSSQFSSVTDNQVPTNTWTIEQNNFQVASSNGVAIAWSILTTAAGTFTVTANFAANSAACIGISEFSGVPSSLPVDGSNSGVGNSAFPSGGSVTPSQSGDLFVSATSDDSIGSHTYVIPSGWDGKRAENPSGTEVLSSASKIATDASAQSSDWSSGNPTNWQAAIVAFKAAGGGGSTISHAPLGSFDPEEIVRAWFDPDLIARRGWFDWELLGPVTVYETKGAFDAETIVKAWFDYELIAKRNWFDWELPLPAVVAGTLFSQSVDGTLTSAATLVNRTGKILAGTLTDSGALVKQTARALTGTLTDSGSLVKQTAKTFAGTLTSAGALVNRAGKVLAGSMASAGALVKQTAKSPAGTLTSSGAIVKQTAHAVAGALASSGTLVKRTGKILAGTMTSSGALAATKVALKALVGTLTSAGALTKQTGKVVAGSLASSGALSRRISTSVAGTLAPIGTAAKRTARALSGALSFLGTLLSAARAPNVDNVLDPVVLRQAAREAIILHPAARTPLVLVQSARESIVLQPASRAAVALTQSARAPIILKTRS